MRFFSKLTLVVLLSMIFLLTLSGCMGGSGAGKKERTVTSVTITSPAPREIVRTIKFTGTLKGSQDVMVYPPLPGKFMGYTRSEGAYVSAGTTVAQIDRDIPAVEYEPVPVEAPISGRFFTMGISPGETVVPQLPIGRISQTSRLKLEFNIPEKYLTSVTEGSRAELYVPTIDYSSTATLTRVSRFIEAHTGGAQAEATLSNPEGILTPGMHAEVSVIIASSQANLALPIDCVLGLDGKFVYVVENRKTLPDTTFITRQVERGKPKTDTLIEMIDVGVAVKRDVEVGLENGSFIEIIAGLEPDEEVLYVGQRIVEANEKIRITGTYDFSGE